MEILGNQNEKSYDKNRNHVYGLTTSRETISIEITDSEEPNYISYINF